MDFLSSRKPHGYLSSPSTNYSLQLSQRKLAKTHSQITPAKRWQNYFLLSPLKRFSHFIAFHSGAGDAHRKQLIGGKYSETHICQFASSTREAQMNVSRRS